MRALFVAASILALFNPNTVHGEPQLQRSASCQSNIVSATVIATFCGHFIGDAHLLDLFILWRGRPGWFQRRANGSGGNRGTQEFGGGLEGKVYQSTDYGDVTVAFYADFDAATVSIEGTEIPIRDVNALFVDDIDRPEPARIVGKLRIDPQLPTAGDVNVLLARRSAQVTRFLQCQTPMPAPPVSPFGAPIPQPPVITVCEKLQKQ